MLKKLLFIILLFCFGLSFSQTKIAYIKDSESIFTDETIKNATFKNFKSTINNGLDNGVYWFKISDIPSKKTTIQIPNNRIREVIAYQENTIISPSENERFRTFETENKATVYLKLNVTREALIPVTVQASKEYLKNEKKNFLFLGFYYGFAFVIGLINLFYYINFKDITFLYYTLFLFAVSFGLSISDGIFNFFNFSEKTIAIAEVTDHCFGVIFGILFATAYLQTEKYRLKSKRNMLFLALLMLILGLLFLMFDANIWYVIMELFVFTILIYCWTIGVVLFSKNLFTKIFVIAYFFILLLGLSFYVTKLLGIPLIIGASKLKFGAFFEMVVLSFAVIYRMKILHQENIKMRKEIVLHAAEVKALSQALKKTLKTPNLAEIKLTLREQEILHLITKGESNKEIGEKLNISVNTVKYHVKNIYDKLQIKSRQEIKKLVL